MKAIALSTIALLVLAVVSIIVLITFVGVNMSPAIKKGYCDVMRGFGGLLPLPESMKPSLPAFCVASDGNQQVFFIETGDPDRIAYELAAYCLACWEKTGKINMGQSTNCYEVVLKKIDGDVTKEKVFSKLPEDFKGKIDWQADIIATAKSIGIYYNATSKLIVVI